MIRAVVIICSCNVQHKAYCGVKKTVQVLSLRVFSMLHNKFYLIILLTNELETNCFSRKQTNIIDFFKCIYKISL